MNFGRTSGKMKMNSEGTPRKSISRKTEKRGDNGGKRKAKNDNIRE